MLIVKNETKTKYFCSICGYKYIEHNDGTKEGEPFTEYERKIKSYKFWEEDTPLGRRPVPHLFEYDGYVCPKCGQVQVTEEDAKEMNDHSQIMDHLVYRGKL